MVFSLLVCCPTLNVLLENYVKDKQGKYEGIYTFHGFSNGMDYWVDAEGENAIWYKVYDSSDSWGIGSLHDLGSWSVDFYSPSWSNLPNLHLVEPGIA